MPLLMLSYLPAALVATPLSLWLLSAELREQQSARWLRQQLPQLLNDLLLLLVDLLLLLVDLLLLLVDLLLRFQTCLQLGYKLLI